MRQLKITKSITNKQDASTTKYLTEVARYPLITAEREVELAILIRKGDQNALREMVECNLRFVVSVAKQFQNRGLTLPDLINEGNLGLIKAAQRFDETRGFKFISYAVWWIRQSILQGISEHSRMIRIPLNKIGLESKFFKSREVLEQKLERSPSDSEIMEMMEMSSGDLFNLLDMCNVTRPRSYDSPMTTDESSGSMKDVLVNYDSKQADVDLMSESLKSDVLRVLKTLTELERNVIAKHFGLAGAPAISLQEIASIEGYTKERVRQIREKALKKLRVRGRLELLRKYMS